MPLDPSTLKSDLENLFKQPGFAEADVAQAWANAMNDYASGVVPPAATPGFAAAVTALAVGLAGFSVANQAAGIMEAAFKAFAAAVATAMLPTNTGVPPTTDVGFATVFATTSADASARAQQLASAIDDWMKLGTATNTASGAPFPPDGKWH